MAFSKNVATRQFLYSYTYIADLEIELVLTDCCSLILTDSHWKVSLCSKHHPEWRLPNVLDFEQKKGPKPVLSWTQKKNQ